MSSSQGFASEVATVVFIDLAGFSAIADVFGDAAAMQVLEGFESMVGEALRGHGAQIKWIGDEAMLAFSEPDARLSGRWERCCRPAGTNRFCRSRAEAPVTGRSSLHPQPVAFAEATFVAVLGLFVNIGSAFLLGGGHHHGHPGHHHKSGHHHHVHDANLRSAYVHVLADALTSVLAIAALLGGRTLGWVWLDPAMGILGSVVIAAWSWSLLRDTAGVLLDTADPHLVEEVRQEVEGPGDARITDLHVRRVGPGSHAAIVSVTGRVDTETVRARLKPVHELAHVTVEMR